MIYTGIHFCMFPVYLMEINAKSVNVSIQMAIDLDAGLNHSYSNIACLLGRDSLEPLEATSWIQKKITIWALE